MNSIFVKNFDAPAIDKSLILRYAGVKEASPETDALLEDCIKECENAFSFRVCYGEFLLTDEGNELNLSFMKTTSHSLKKNLAGCKSVILFAATVGLTIDRLIARYSVTAPARALMFDAIGGERIESLANTFNAYIIEEKKTAGLFTATRYSPGYGDFPLKAQREIFSVLNCSKNIGLTLNNSLLMSPQKSVSAIIGITDCEQKNKAGTVCNACNKTDCAFRRAE